MADDTKRIVAASTAVPVSSIVSIQFQNPDTIQTNLHNIWFSVCVEPESADANANGTWVLYREEDSTRAIFDPTTVNLNLETINYKIVACGCWTGSNQTPYNMSDSLF